MATEETVPDPNEVLSVVLGVDGMSKSPLGGVRLDLGGEQELKTLRVSNEVAQKIRVGQFVRLTLTIEPEGES